MRIGRVLDFAADHVGDALWLALLAAAAGATIVFAIVGPWWVALVTGGLAVPPLWVTVSEFASGGV